MFADGCLGVMWAWSVQQLLKVLCPPAQLLVCAQYISLFIINWAVCWLGLFWQRFGDVVQLLHNTVLRFFHVTKIKCVGKSP